MADALPSVTRISNVPDNPKGGDVIVMCFKLLGCADSACTIKSAKFGKLKEGTDFFVECHKGIMCVWYPCPTGLAAGDDITIFVDSPGMTSYSGITHINP